MTLEWLNLRDAEFAGITFVQFCPVVGIDPIAENLSGRHQH